MTDFVHLHLHSEYSLLDGACRIKQVVNAAKEAGQKALAITDHGVMFGVVDFYKAAKNAGIKPIIGCEIYVAPRKRTDKTHEYDSDNRHLVLLAKDNEGYHNLLKIVSDAYIEGFYIKPRTDKETLKKYHKGIIALSACLAGEIPGQILKSGYQAGLKAAGEYKEIFGDDFYLELQSHGIKEQEIVNASLIRISKELNIPLVATNDVHYINKEDALAQRVLMCIQTGKTLDDENAMAFETEEFYLKTGDEMESLFKDTPEAIYNTVKIAEMCNVEFEFNKLHLPKYDVPEGFTAPEYLRSLCEKGFKKRYGEKPDETLIQRMNYELSTIEQMGFVDYFLIVWDFIKYAKDNDIPVGPGRGSAAGSIVSYSLGITDIDPIKYSLLFERFLNPERVSMPDIDIDFCNERRSDVINYVVRKYGRDKVAQIVTFGTLAARGAIRDVGRVLNIPYNEVDVVAKLVPEGPNVTIERALEVSAELRTLYESNEKIKNLIDMARKLEGMPRHSSIHAAGLVITADRVDEYVPLLKSDELAVTQFTMTTLEELGLLKMDFLALRNLTVIKYAEDMISKKTGKRFSTADLPTDDKKVYEMLSTGQTLGVFQLESPGMRQVLTSLKPQSFEDIIAVISLFRPGPMDSIPRFIENKNHPERIKYKTPLLKDILDVTFGCIVYQEQVMQIVRRLAGYSYGRADLVRRAMAKKKADVMEKERNNFIYGIKNKDGTYECKGAVNNGIDEKTAIEIFDEMASFASYAFNKSHAAAYAAVAYRTAYLKVYYPSEYMAALISSVIGSTDKIIEYINECNKLGISVLPPDINESEVEFSVTDEKHIRFGLVAIKSIGYAPINDVIAERNANGKFRSFYDFIKRMSGKGITKKVVEMLICAGAFDSLGLYRSQMLRSYEMLMDEALDTRRQNLEGQTDLFSLISEEETKKNDEPEYPNIPEMPLKQLLSLEKESMGMYISGHPLSEYKDIIKDIDHADLKDIISSFKEEGQALFEDNQRVTAVGIINSIKLKTTRSNTTMAFISLEDLTASIEVIVFPKILEKLRKVLKEGSAVLIQGRISVKEEDDAKIILDEAVNIENYKPRPKENNKKGLYIKVSSKDSTEFNDALKIIKIFNGNSPLYVYFEDVKKCMLASKNLWVDESDVLISELKEILGENSVILYK